MEHRTKIGENSVVRDQFAIKEGRCALSLTPKGPRKPKRLFAFLGRLL
jgi:hypothetical protein